MPYPTSSTHRTFTLTAITLCLVATSLGCGFFGRDPEPTPPPPAEDMTTAGDMSGAARDMGMVSEEDMGMVGEEDMASEPDMHAPSEAEAERCAQDAREDRCEVDPATYQAWGEVRAMTALSLLSPDCCEDINGDGLVDNFYGELIEALGSAGIGREEYNDILADDLLTLDAQVLYELRADTAAQRAFITSLQGQVTDEERTTYAVDPDDFAVGAYSGVNSASFDLPEGGSGPIIIEGGRMSVRARMLGLALVLPMELVRFEGELGAMPEDTLSGTATGYVQLVEIFDAINAAIPEQCGCVENLSANSISWPGDNLSEASCSIQKSDLDACASGDEQERYCAARLEFCDTFASFATAGADISTKRPEQNCTSDDNLPCDALSMSHSLSAESVQFEGAK